MWKGSRAPILTTQYLNDVLRHGGEAKKNIQDQFYSVRYIATREHRELGLPLPCGRQWKEALSKWMAMWRELSGTPLAMAAVKLIEGVLGVQLQVKKNDRLHQWVSEYDSRIQFGKGEEWRRNYCKAMDLLDVTDELGCTVRLHDFDGPAELDWLRHGSGRKYDVGPERNYAVNITGFIVPPMPLEPNHFRDFENLVTVNAIQLTRNMFLNCKALRTPPILPDASEIPENCFAGCTAMRTVKLPPTVVCIEPYAFASSGVESIDFGSCRDFGSHCFQQTRLKSVKIAKQSVPVKVGSYAFAGISSLVHVDFGGVQHIGLCSFTQCVALTMITIPATVVSIGWGAFWGCDLRRITVAPRAEAVGVDSRAFAHNYNLRAVDASAMSLEDSKGGYTGMQFVRCVSLTLAVVHPDAMEAYDMDELQFSGVMPPPSAEPELKWISPVPESARIRLQALPGEIKRLTAVAISDSFSMDPLPYLHRHVDEYRWLWRFAMKHRVGGLPAELWAVIMGYLAPVDEQTPW